MKINRMRPPEDERILISGFVGEECPLEIGWNWLMPVVEKIRLIATGDNRLDNLLSYKIEIGCQAKVFFCSISKSYWPNQGDHKKEFICGRRDLTSLINVTWISIIKFIKWYNTQTSIK